MDKTQLTTVDKLADCIIEGLQDKKAENIVKINLSSLPNAVCKYFIICHGNSKTQVEAIADSAVIKVKKSFKENPWQKEGYENAEWILIDYVDVVLHIFQPDVRKFYKIEELWADADITEIKYEL